MKRILLAITTLLLINTNAYSQSNDTTSKEEVPMEITNMKGFHSIRVLGNLSVEIHETQETPSMYVDMKNNLPKRFDWSIRDSVLTISFSANSKSNAVKVLLYCNPSIQKFTISRADVQLYDISTSELTDINLKEGARLSGALNCLDLELEMSGRAVASLNGKAKYQTITVGRKCALNAEKLMGCSTILNASNLSEVYVCATERFVGDVNGRTSVFYNGNPTILRINKSSLSTINSIGAK